MSTATPTTTELLAACFRVRHRLVHVFGIPTAVGLVGAAAATTVVATNVALGLGATAAGVGTLLYGWFVCVGFDRKLVEQLQAEGGASGAGAGGITSALASASPDTKPYLDRIGLALRAIEGAVAWPHVLGTLQEDITRLQTQVLVLARHVPGLKETIARTNAHTLEGELARMAAELDTTPAGPLRDALEASRASTEQALGQWRAAIATESKIRNAFVRIETDLAVVKASIDQGTVAADTDALRARLEATTATCAALVTPV